MRVQIKEPPCPPPGGKREGIPPRCGFAAPPPGAKTRYAPVYAKNGRFCCHPGQQKRHSCEGEVVRIPQDIAKIRKICPFLGPEKKKTGKGVVFQKHASKPILERFTHGTGWHRKGPDIPGHSGSSAGEACTDIPRKSTLSGVPAPGA